MHSTSQRDSVKKEHENIKVRVRVCCPLRPASNHVFFCDGTTALNSKQRLAIGFRLSDHRGLVTLGEGLLTPTRVLIARSLHMPCSSLFAGHGSRIADVDVWNEHREVY